jgi:hypothetical protein
MLTIEDWISENTRLTDSGMAVIHAPVQSLLRFMEGKKVVIDEDACEHEWVDARNAVVLSGEVCLKCNSIRAGNI